MHMPNNANIDYFDSVNLINLGPTRFFGQGSSNSRHTSLNVKKHTIIQIYKTYIIAKVFASTRSILFVVLAPHCVPTILTTFDHIKFCYNKQHYKYNFDNNKKTIQNKEKNAQLKNAQKAIQKKVKKKWTKKRLHWDQLNLAKHYHISFCAFNVTSVRSIAMENFYYLESYEGQN
ncbi:hypothetical protein ACJX0J_018172, partial [Zea mays]